jgi:uncharacterized protein (TIGR02452 family)
MGKEENIIIFEDTVEKCRDIPQLMESIMASRAGQQLVLEQENFPCGKENRRFQEPAQLVLSGQKSFEAAQKYRCNPQFADSKICVLNFASAMNPGGGVKHGSSAQEESLCRCSTLYFCLDEASLWQQFYLPHRNGLSSLHNDDLIYTPNVTVFKDDSPKNKLLDEKDWYHVDVISCAAPNLHRYFGQLLKELGAEEEPAISPKHLFQIHTKRLGRILDVAVQQQVDVMILGAFGCGAFMNDPAVVSKAMVQVAREYAHCFKVIEFPVFCRPREKENYVAFQQALSSI